MPSATENALAVPRGIMPTGIPELRVAPAMTFSGLMAMLDVDYDDLGFAERVFLYLVALGFGPGDNFSLSHRGAERRHENFADHG